MFALTAYEAGTDNQIGLLELPNLNEEEAIDIFDLESDDDLDVLTLNAGSHQKLQEDGHVNRCFSVDLNSYDYFVEKLMTAQDEEDEEDEEDEDDEDEDDEDDDDEDDNDC